MLSAVQRPWKLFQSLTPRDSGRGGIGGQRMRHRLLYASIVDGPRKTIHVVRVLDDLLDLHEIDQIIATARDCMLSKTGEQFADVVLIQGDSKETFRIFGHPHAVSRVREAM